MKRVLLLLAVLVLLLGGVEQVRAEFVITFSQVGGNVEAIGSGTINLTGLSFAGIAPEIGLVDPSLNEVILGPRSTTVPDIYRGVNTGPASLGFRDLSEVTTGTGSTVGVSGLSGEIYVQDGYASGGNISSSATWDNTTISGLGLTPGTYTWTWGSGADADSLEVIVPSAIAVPEPYTLTLLGIGTVCSLGYGWRRWRQSA